MSHLHSDVLRVLLDNYVSLHQAMSQPGGVRAALNDIGVLVNGLAQENLYKPRGPEHDSRYFVFELDTERLFTVFEDPISGKLAVDTSPELLTDARFVVTYSLFASAIHVKTLDFYLDRMKNNPVTKFLATKPKV